MMSESIYDAVYFTRRLVSARASFVRADFGFNFNHTPVQFYVSGNLLVRTNGASSSPFFLLLHEHMYTYLRASTLSFFLFLTRTIRIREFCPSATFTHSLNFLANYGNPFWPSGRSLPLRSVPISIPCIIHSSLRRESRDVAIHLSEELVPIMSGP